mmetsp:Transcript_10214/g.22469  ORF Transcript_10214/g.22469 Transcript_10214/m.22469 type:complete len:147 (+) Transcript_10214:520-960(+)|eukprot:CAMPEP_0116908554 /NCGR_PEP_ID=MMETSP0467-20121206/13761_1 /TAXON_ID=283647 /ORGANISM="Mesodinium pulex, Strain SPMC105" /LENGTH=146 /DNA_ID=CAMNT_0004583767 /DNA_START=1676 /DNA_END=2116 /DNA_ORIENTATION=+
MTLQDAFVRNKQLNNSSFGISKTEKRPKTKEELAQIRKEMMKSKTNKNREKKQLEVVGDFVNDMKVNYNNRQVSSPTQDSQPGRTPSRLASGNRLMVNAKEAHNRSKRMYEKLPEQKRKELEKTKMDELKERQRKQKEFSQNLRRN